MQRDVPHPGTCHARAAAGNAPRHAAGFTLLEVLVSLVVLGVLLTALSQGTQFGLHAWQAQTRTLAQRSDLDAVDRALRRLIVLAIPGAAPDGKPFVGTASTALFNTVLPIPAGPLAEQDATVALGVDARHRLVMRWVPYLHAARFAAAPPAREELLLDGVERIALSYWRGAAPDGAGPPGWVQAWNTGGLPALVRLRIVFADHRVWPDIVAAPLRSPPPA
jgi:general secretion pathway protein J